jgi:hypothetical protein
MSDESGKPGTSLREAMELEKAGLLEQIQLAAARVREIDQKLAKLVEYEQLAAEFNFGLVAKPAVVVAGSGALSDPVAPAPAPTAPTLRDSEKSAVRITIGDLIDKFLTDPRSSYHKLRFQTRGDSRAGYDRIKRDRGQVLLTNIGKTDLEGFYRVWSAEGTKLAIGHSLMGRLRTLFTFGATILENEDCQRLCGIYRMLHFAAPKSRVERLTAEQASALCAIANKQGLSSIAVAQAIQFETELRQRDVIGEWVPFSEPGLSLTINEKGEKWLRGIRWEEIDSNLILTHEISTRQRIIKSDLKTASMILKEFGTSDRSRLPASGPIIISESTGYPYRTEDFRKKWRKIADLAGIPKTVKNLDNMRPNSADDGGLELGADTAR